MEGYEIPGTTTARHEKPGAMSWRSGKGKSAKRFWRAGMNTTQSEVRRQAVQNRSNARRLRTMLVSLNARFEHENPAAWYLKAACDKRGTSVCGDVAVLSRTINDDLNRIFGTVAAIQPDVVALSCYIWNRVETLRLCADLRAVFPCMVLVAGGPEVSYADGGDEYRAAGADLILAGEGEATFPDLLETLSSGTWPDSETEESWRRIAPPLKPEQLVSPCSPEYLALLSGRIAYLESSRGCPYRCSYCLSSESLSMTWIPLDRIHHELEQLVGAGVKVVKFVDRTFNLSEERTLSLWNHVKRYKDTGIVFHFEVAPDLLSKAQIALLGELPAGLVQIEAGIQSTHADTLARIGRKMEVERALCNLQQVLAVGNVHVHADLIAGLPGEGYAQFAASFNRLAAVSPHHLQLGFLKLLRGTRLWRESGQWGYVRRGYAPYEVIASSALSVGDMLRLKDIEETLERFANSGRFLLVMQWLLPQHVSPFMLFEALADKQRRMGLMGRAVSSDALFRCMLAFLTEDGASAGNLAGEGGACSAGNPMPDAGVALLRLDWVCAHRNPFLPEWLADGNLQISAETNWLRVAYGMGNDGDHQVRNPNVRTIRNRYHAAVVVLPDTVRTGIRFVPGADGVADNRFRILIDVKVSNPVLGRPEPVAIPL